MSQQDGALNRDSTIPEDYRDVATGTTIRPSGRKLVLFADGTGNAFTTQESSIWRLYEALDHTRPDQIAYYIKGVGTAGWAPLAALDGATGIGVPSNVRKLYRFLCWNWREGDEIYIFGFSRGAFTARTLASLIASQGLMPAEIKGEPVSHAEMKRNTMSAWREYRRGTVPLRKTWPTIWITRLIRDVLLYLYHWICGHRSYANVRADMNGRKDVDIEFLSLFDTVEAFGVPVEELRVAIDWAIWPISFRNHRPAHKVKHICHALALDDERTTFHPLRIDQSRLAAGQTVEEVWFAGVHSDIGGGYPESTLSFVPLVWMADRLEGRLRFKDGEIEHFKEHQSAIGPMHDSRSGAAVFYRYGPRPILAGEVNGGLPVVHFAVIERILFGCDTYAPIMLPAEALVLMPDGSKLNLGEDATREAMKRAYLAKAAGQQREAEAAAFTQMGRPSVEIARLTRDTVWWRRVAYFSLLFMASVIVAWPWIARSLVGASKENGLEGTLVLRFITAIDWLVGAVLGPLANLIRNVLPSYAAPWLDITLYYPFLTSLVLLVTYLVWRRNTVLRDTIQERARLAWSRPRRMASQRHAEGPSLLLGFARWMRTNGGPARWVFSRLLLPGIFLFIIFYSALLIVSTSVFTARTATGNICTTPGQETGTPVLDQPTDARGRFATREFCWWSGLAVEKGRRYRVWIEIDEPWFDRTIMSGPNGFKTHFAHHYLALPTLRQFGAAWFQPVVRVGTKGMSDLALEAINMVPAEELPRRMHPTIPLEQDGDKSKGRYPTLLDRTNEFETLPSDHPLKLTVGKLGRFEAVPNDPTARAIWQAQNLGGRLVAEFVAPDAGDLFFYVNDAVQIYPTLLPAWLRPAKLDVLQGPYDQFYGNNAGTARIVVQRLPSPAMPAENPGTTKQ